MKAISLWQPWASLIAAGSKTYETRSWPTTYRGPLAIHAAMKDTADIRALTQSRRFQNGLAPLFKKTRDYENLPDYGITFEMLPKGSIIAIVEVRDCVVTQDLPEGKYWDERYFGDYTPGRFAWEMDLIEVLKEPIPMKGMQGFFECGLEVKW